MINKYTQRKIEDIQQTEMKCRKIKKNTERKMKKKEKEEAWESEWVL